MRKTGVAVVAIVVIFACVCRLWPRGEPRVTTTMVERPRMCLDCKARFLATTEPILVECPTCHKRAGARLYHYVCRDCGARFEAYVERPSDPSVATVDPIKPPDLVFRREGGEWVRSVKTLGIFVCPKCKSTNVGPPFPR